MTFELVDETLVVLKLDGEAVGAIHASAPNEIKLVSKNFLLYSDRFVYIFKFRRPDASSRKNVTVPTNKE
jgi:hypothetical protein